MEERRLSDEEASALRIVLPLCEAERVEGTTSHLDDSQDGIHYRIQAMNIHEESDCIQDVTRRLKFGLARLSLGSNLRGEEVKTLELLQQLNKGEGVQKYLLDEHRIFSSKLGEIEESKSKVCIEVQLTCDVCGVPQHSETSLAQHKRKAHKLDLFQCDICSQIFHKKTQLVLHKKSHYMGRGYKCDLCSKVLFSYSCYKEHHKVHEGDKRFMCEMCGSMFHLKSHLRMHMHKHSGGRLYFCKVCKKSFGQKLALQLHSRMHGLFECDIDVLPCSECHRSFLSLDLLTKHKRVHATCKRYMCEICGETFSTTFWFNNHKRVHLLEKCYGCTICGRLFASCAQLRMHKVSHVGGGKSHVCNICGKTFRNRPQLMRHMLVHSGQKTYMCDMCGILFRHLTSLMVHLRTRHIKLQNRKIESA